MIQPSYSSPQARIDQDLLFGVQALQTRFITSAQFLEVCSFWAVRKENSLAKLLVDRGYISDKQEKELRHTLDGRIDRRNGDVRATLSEIADGSVRDMIRQIDDEDILRSLNTLPLPDGARVRLRRTRKLRTDEERYFLIRKFTEGVSAGSGSPATTSCSVR